MSALLKIVRDSNEMQPHPAAEIFPLMTGADFDALVADIRDNGQREPIIVHDGLILDGRNRYRACRQLGVEPETLDWHGSGSPVAFVVSMNLRRRHLNESQRAMVAKRLANLPHGGDRRSDQAANLPLVSQAEAAKTLHVSERAVRHAAVVQEKAAPELVAAVERGDIPVSTAADLVDLPKARQREIASAGKKAAAKSAKHIRVQKQAKRNRAPAAEAPKQTQHDRDLEFLRSAWSSSCETARTAFLEEVNRQ